MELNTTCKHRHVQAVLSEMESGKRKSFKTTAIQIVRKITRILIGSNEAKFPESSERNSNASGVSKQDTILKWQKRYRYGAYWEQQLQKIVTLSKKVVIKEKDDERIYSYLVNYKELLCKRVSYLHGWSVTE